MSPDIYVGALSFSGVGILSQRIANPAHLFLQGDLFIRGEQKSGDFNRPHLFIYGNKNKDGIHDCFIPALQGALHPDAAASDIGDCGMDGVGRVMAERPMKTGAINSPGEAVAAGMLVGDQKGGFIAAGEHAATVHHAVAVKIALPDMKMFGYFGRCSFFMLHAATLVSVGGK